MSAPAAPAVAPPSAVVWSYRLYLAGAVLGLVGIVLTLILLPVAMDQAVQRLTQATQGQNTRGVDVAAFARGSVIAGTVLGAVIALVLSVLTFVFAGRLRQGRNWARIVLLVFAVLQVLGVLSAAGVGALQFVVVIIAAILSFLPASNAWFRAGRALPARTV